MRCPPLEGLSVFCGFTVAACSRLLMERNPYRHGFYPGVQLNDFGKNTLSEILPLKTGAFDLNDINVIKIGHRVIKAATYILLPCCLLT